MQQIKQLPAEHRRGAVSKEHKRIERIRSRSSYLFFQQLYDFLETNPDIADVLRKLYDVLDDRYSFGSVRNAEYAAESLDWVLKDKGVMGHPQRYKAASSSIKQSGGTLSQDGG